MKEQERCKKCGGPPGKSINKSLCRECIRSLPRCYTCGTICGAEEWNYKEETKAIPCILKKSAEKKRAEKIILCGGCKEELFKKECLLPSENVKILLKEIEILGD